MANALRGGKKSYGGKTLIGNFVEDGAAEGRDITSTQFSTTAMSQQYDISSKPGRFGAGLFYEKPNMSNPLSVNDNSLKKRSWPHSHFYRFFLLISE